MTPTRTILIALIIALAGCAEFDPAATNSDTGDAPDAEQTATATATGEPPAGQATSAKPHGEVKRSETDVTTRIDGTQYVASKTVQLSNGAGHATAVDFAADFSSGFLRMTPGHDGYSYSIVLEVRAETEQAARNAMDQVVVDHADSLNGGTLALSTAISLGPQATGILGGSANLRTLFTAAVPSLPTDIDVDVSTADLTFNDIQGETFDITTSTGDIEGEVDYARAVISVSTGDTDLEGTLRSVTTTGSTGSFDFTGRMDALSLDRSTGDVTLDVTPGASGAYSLMVSTAAINVDIRGGADRGQDVTVDTTTGGIDVDLAGGEDVGAQSEDHVHVRTAGYDGKSIKTGITIRTSTGDVYVWN